MKVNVNEWVKVKLKAEGIAELERQHNELRERLPKLKPFSPPKTDDEGYTKFQLHCLMNRFGHMMVLGAEPPFELDILVGVS